MAIGNVGRFRAGQLNELTTWTGLTEEKHLHNAFNQLSPQWLDNTIRHMIDMNYGMTFTRWLDQFNTVYIDNDQPFKWSLQAYQDKTCRLVGAYIDEAGATAVSTVAEPGKNGQALYLDFSERRFTETAHIVGENPDYYQLRIQEGWPVQIGNNWRYKCILIRNTPNHFIPASELVAGTRWSIEGGSVPKYGSYTGQDISFQTPFAMEERLSKFRFKHKVHGEMIRSGKNKPYVVGLPDAEGNIHKYWLSYMEWELLTQFYKRQSEVLFYGQSTVDSYGRSHVESEDGNAIIAGRGIRNQFLPTNQHFYNNLSLDLLVNTALDMSVGKVDMNNREFVIGTGEWGLRELHRMMEKEHIKYASYNWLGDNTGRAYEWTGDYSGNGLKFKRGQFVSVAEINGIRFHFTHFAHYDNLTRNKKAHPKGGMAESHRLTVMDFGSKQDPNIHKVRIKGVDPIYTYVPGLYSPYSPPGSPNSRPGMGANGFEGYELHLSDQVGAVVKDPTRIVEWIPAVLSK